MSKNDAPIIDLSPRKRSFEKFWNSVLRIPLPWRFRLAPHRNWENQKLGEPHGPDQFLELTTTSQILLDEVVSRAISKDAAILDLGCNAGRHMHALWARGFRNLHGVDIQHSALEMMRRAFPNMMSSVTVSQGTFQDYLPSIPDGAFEISFTHGATVELVPPTFPICRELARVSRDFVILLISESGHLYPRLWEREFILANFVLIKLLRPCAAGCLSSLMVFQRQKI